MVRIVIPALSTSAPESTTLSVNVDNVPDIPYESLTGKEKAGLREHLVRAAKASIQQANFDDGSWDLPGFDSEQHEFDLSIRKLQEQAWCGDAAIYKLSGEVLTEIKPALPLGCVKVCNIMNATSNFTHASTSLIR